MITKHTFSKFFTIVFSNPEYQKGKGKRKFANKMSITKEFELNAHERLTILSTPGIHINIEPFHQVVMFKRLIFNRFIFLS